MPELQYHLNDFEGPLDLLLSLIQKNKIDIHDIPIVLICEQYMEYIEDAERLDLEIAGEFLIMASELMLIKSKILLPGINDQDDPRAELVNRLELYIATKKAAEALKPLYAEYSGRIEKEMDEIRPERGELTDLDSELLTKALSKILLKINSIQAPASTLISPLVSIPMVSVKEKGEEIIEYLSNHEAATLYTLLIASPNKAELIARFMAILEMVRNGQIYISKGIFDAEEKLAPDEDPEPRPSKINRDYDATEDITIVLRLNKDYKPDENFISEFEYDKPEDDQPINLNLTQGESTNEQ